MRLYKPGERRGNATYVAKGRVNGRDFEIRTGQTNERAARQAWARFADAIKSGALDAPEPESEDGFVFRDLIEAYIAARKPSYQDSLYLEKIKTSDLADYPVSEVVSGEVQRIARKTYPDAQNETINRQFIGPVAWIMHHGEESGIVEYRRFRKFPEKKPASRAPKQGVMSNLRKAVRDDPYKYALLTWLELQGWRITETLMVTWDQLYLDEGYVNAWIKKSRTHKSIWLDHEMIEVLRELPRLPDGRVFPWRTRQGVQHWLKPLREKLGVAFTPHMARHAFGKAIRDPRDLVASNTWTDIAAPTRYVETDEERARSILTRRREATKEKPHDDSAELSWAETDVLEYDEEAELERMLMEEDRVGE